MTLLARIAGVGVACPLGLRSRLAASAIDAGISRFAEREDVVGTDGPAGVSMLEGVGLALASRTERAAFFASHAVMEAVTRVGKFPQQPLPCVLALPGPEAGPGIEPNVLLQQLVRLGPNAARLNLHHVVEEGRAGIFQAIDVALALLAQGHAPLVLVVGVDSLVDRDTLRGLVDNNRLTSRSNRDGIIPGEAAGCVLLGHPDVVAPAQTLALLLANAVTREPMPINSETSPMSTAQGLTAVFRHLRHVFGGRVDEVFEGSSGEMFFGREFAYAYLRNAALMPEPLRRRALSSALGDVGAAAGAVSLVQAILCVGPSGPGNRSPNRTGLAYASSDSGLVGGCVVGAAR